MSTGIIQAGQHVRVTFEGKLTNKYGAKLILNGSDSMEIELANGNSVWVEVDNYLDDLGIEVVKPPFTDGLYYEPLGDNYDQISLVYKHESGKWYDFQLDEIDPSPETLSTLVRLGAVS